MWRDLLDSCCNNIDANKILTENMAVIKTKVNNGRFNMTRAMNANIAPPPPPVGKRSSVMSVQSVCVSALRRHISETSRPIFTKFV